MKKSMLGAVVALPVAIVSVALLVWARLADIPWYERHILPNTCARDPRDLHFIWATRGGAVLAGVVGLLVVAPLLWRWASRRTPAVVLYSTLSIVAAIVASVGTIALVQHWKGNQKAKQRPPKPVLEWREYQHVFGIVPRQQAKFYGTLVHGPVTFTIDAHGNRHSSTSHALDYSRPSLIINGESIGFGYAMDWDQTLGALLERETSLQVANLSVPGYGADQEYLRLLEELPKFSHPQAVAVLFLPAMITRSGILNHPHFKLKDGKLELQPSIDVSELKQLTSMTYHDDEYLEITRAILRAHAKAIRDAGARPLFVVIDAASCAPLPGTLTPWVLDELFDKEKLPYVRVEYSDDEKVPGDSHPRAEVHRRIADAIEKALDLPRPEAPK